MNDNNLGTQAKEPPLASFFKGDSRHLLTCLILTFVGLCLYAVGGFFFALPAAIFGTALFAVAVSADEKHIATRIFVLAVFGAALLFFGNLTQAFLLLCLFFPGGLALSSAVRKEYPLNDTVLRMFLAMALSLFLTGGCWLIEFGTDMKLSSLSDPLIAACKEFFGQVYDSLLASGTYAYLLPVRDSFIYSSFQLTVATIPVMISLFLLTVSVPSYWLIKKIYTLMNRTEPDKVRFFGAFIYTRISKTGAVIYMITSILTIFASSGADGLFFSTVESVLTFVFCYAGTALIGFLMKMKGLPSGVRYLVYCLLFILCLLPFGLRNLISLIGFVDAFWHLRRFIRPLGASSL